jgi:hypothetical protein
MGRQFAPLPSPIYSRDVLFMTPIHDANLLTCLFFLDVYRSAAQIGRQLAYIGDTINERHAPQFNQMIRLMNLTPETAYEAFAGIARK